jgi:hypothetical protein
MEYVEKVTRRRNITYNTTKKIAAPNNTPSQASTHDQGAIRTRKEFDKK